MSGGESASGRKAYAQAIVKKLPRLNDEPRISFKARETEHPNHDDALVVSVCITNTQVMRVMIDTMSSTDCLYFDAF
ncbi:hypothetical protein GW17_00040852 [Ensete ventricosum]|nr:hypothetical protein GW17_00040852 [Ensete ventricosum]RZR76426.1 hypothetical protein BHM03_00001173 [Ensete ventricosum]